MHCHELGRRRGTEFGQARTHIAAEGHLDDVGAALCRFVFRGRDVGQQYRGGIETVEFGAPPRGQVGQARVESVTLPPQIIAIVEGERICRR
ncbi:Uncharacterised protein [Mycobacteroides abscessus subsp. abscessus]|nr:Uncharacterised protein [Mycobacteroides abscessus subsp. abscessus]